MATLTLPAPPETISLPPPPGAGGEDIRLDPWPPERDTGRQPQADVPVVEHAPWGVPHDSQGTGSEPGRTIVLDPFATPGAEAAHASGIGRRAWLLARGFVLGGLAAAFAAWLWAFGYSMTSLQLGFLAALTGLLVAGAVRVGTAQEGGAVARGMAMLLALGSLLAAQMLMARPFALEQYTEQGLDLPVPLTELFSRAIDNLLDNQLTFVLWAFSLLLAWALAAPLRRR